ncbi:MAG TPA: class I SAM-dependent methyltransferase [Acidimicrobiales bacterium]|jgi:SAM-dependent methyltransferase|nr:class I SAM-dependent methyltransferase [Acidimicrobiales bacterium]
MPLAHHAERTAPFERMENELVRLASGPVLDLGCGSGFWLPRIRAHGLAAVGVEENRDRAREAAGLAPVVVGDGTRIPLADASVGAVWCLHVLHHLALPGAALAEARRVLRPGGHLFLVESVDDSPVLRLARRVAPQWEGVPVRSRFRADALMDMVTGAGFAVIERRHHSPISFVALALPVGGHALWRRLQSAEQRLPGHLHRWGAHLDCIATTA